MQPSAAIVGSNCEVSPRVLASLTGRVGVLVDPLGHTLLYGKGGGAWMDSDILITPNSSFRNPNTFPDAPATGADTGAYSKAWGGTVGAGIEHGLTPAWSIGLEYDYYPSVSGADHLFPAKRHRARRANGTHPDLSCNRESQARHRRTLLGDVDDKRHAELSWRLQWVQFIPARSVYREHRALRRVRASELSVRHRP